MNRSPPLSYESLKNVLVQMDANTRFLLFTRIPSLRPTDKVVPLRIQTFSALNNRFKINDTVYQVVIYKKYPDVKNSSCVLTDLDQYGFEDDSGKNVLTPGDVDFRDERFTGETREPGYHQREERIPDLEKKLEELQRKLEFVESFGPIPKGLRKTTSFNAFKFRNLINEFVNGIEQATPQRFPEFEEARKMAHVELTGDIKNQMAKLQPFYSRRDGVPVPYKTFLQFSVTSPRQNHIERIQYSKKIHESAKYLSTRLFGNRRHPVHISMLNLCGDGIMRLPVGLRFKIEEIQQVTNIHTLQKSLVPLLDAPFKRLNAIINNDDDFESPILKEAQHLRVFEDLPYQIRPPVVLNLQNLSFYKISRTENSWSVEDFLLVIKNWVESGKKVNSCYSFGTSEHVKNTILGKITEEYKDAETGDEFVAIRTIFNNQVKVSVEKGKALNRWDVKLEVLPIELASQ